MTALPRHGAARPFVWRYVVAVLVDWIGAIGLMAVVYRATGDAWHIALLLICKQVLPGALVPAVVGWLDRRRGGRDVAGSALAQGFALAAIGWVQPGVTWFALATVVGLSGSVLRAQLRAAMARRLGESELVASNGQLNVALGIAGVVGPGIGVAALALGEGVALLFAGGVAVALAAFVRSIASDARATTGAPVPEPVAVVDHPGRSRSMLAMLAMVGVVMASYSMDEPALLPFSDRELSAGATGYGAIVMAWSCGSLIGAVAFTRLMHRSMIAIWCGSTLLAGLGYVALGLSPTVAVAVIVAVVGGIGQGLDWVAVVTMVQRATPRGLEAVAAARLEAVATAAPGIGIVAGGLLTQLAGPRAALVLPGIVVCVVATLVMRGAATRRAPRREAGSRIETTFIPSIQGKPS